MTASATVPTVRPASSAASREELSGRSPTIDVDAGLVQVQRVRVPLAAEAEDGDLAGEQVDVAAAWIVATVGSFR